MSFAHSKYKDSNDVQDEDGSDSYTEFIMEEFTMLESEYQSNKLQRKNRKHKWREIEAINEKKRLKRELNTLDYDYDFFDEE